MTTKIPNPLRLDPTRTTTLVRRFYSEIVRRLNALLREINKLIVEEDVFGLTHASGFLVNEFTPTLNAGRWQFKTDDEKVRAFREWLKGQIDAGLLSVDRNTGRPWLETYIHSAYRQGVVRAFVDAGGAKMVAPSPFIQGAKAQFLRDAFAQPEAVSKLKLLSTRAFEELKGVSDQMAKDMNRILSDGIAHGKNPKQIAKTLADEVGFTKKRALRVARTEIIHAHAEGQLDSFERLGVEELGVEVEFITAGDSRVCPVCRSLAGTVRSVQEARGVIPVHPNCRCAWVPYVSIDGEPKIKAAVSKSVTKSRKKKQTSSSR